MTNWQDDADDLRRIITSDPETHAAWREGGVAAALRVVAAQRDEARQVAWTCNDIMEEMETLDAILPGSEPHEVELYGKKCDIQVWRDELPWLTETPDGEA